MTFGPIKRTLIPIELKTEAVYPISLKDLHLYFNPEVKSEDLDFYQALQGIFFVG